MVGVTGNIDPVFLPIWLYCQILLLLLFAGGTHLLLAHPKGLRNKGMRPFNQKKPVNKQFGLAINGQYL